MGPRPFGRGNMPVLTAARSQYTLQWGRGLSAAETWFKKAPMLGYWWLQWGRGLSAAETVDGGHHSGGERHASMGPRPFGHGNLPSRNTCLSVMALQWGRGLSATETMPSRPGRTSTPCFNGAAAFRPRKPNGGRNICRPDICFNGAAAFRPRKHDISHVSAVHPRSFNGAAAFRPRKPSGGHPSTKHLMLQWGRGLSATETAGHGGGSVPESRQHDYSRGT